MGCYPRSYTFPQVSVIPLENGFNHIGNACHYLYFFTEKDHALQAPSTVIRRYSPTLLVNTS